MINHILSKSDLKDSKNLTVVSRIYTGRFCEIDKVFHNSSPRIFFARKRYNLEKYFQISKVKPDDYDKNVAILQRTLHHNVVRYLNYITEPDKRSYTVFMPFYEKGSIQDMFPSKGKSLSTATIKLWLPKLLSALFFFHERGFAHRNIRLSSFLITASGNDVVLAGFGKHVSGYQFTYDIMRSTMFNDLVYQAPEMAQICTGVWPYNAQHGDLWAMGVSLFIMLNIEPPFSPELHRIDPLEFYQCQRTSRYAFKPSNCTHENESLRQLCGYFLEPIGSRRITAQQALTHNSMLGHFS